MTLRQYVTKRVVVGLFLFGAATPLIGFVVAAQQRAAAGSSDTPAPPGLPVETTRAVMVDSYETRRTFTGVVKARRASELGFERTGRLVEVNVDEGDRVSAGQVLAQLDRANLLARQRELQAQRLAASARLDELLAGPRRETIAAARASVRDMESQLELAQLNFERRKELVKASAVSREEFEQTKLGVASAAARLDVAQRQLEEMETGTRQEQIAAQRAAVAQLEAALENVAVDLDESSILAPFAGTIAERYIDEGTVVAPGTALLKLVELDDLEAWIGLPAPLAAQLSVGQRLEVEVAGQPYPAEVRAVLPELDPSTRTRMAILGIAETGNSVVPAQIARVVLSESVDTAGVWLPLTALARGSRGLWSVLVAEPSGEGHVAQRREIELLHTDGERALVRGTVSPGEIVVASGSHRIVAGQRVRLTKSD